MVVMKGIPCCGDCGYYNWQKHKCSRGCKDEGTAQDHFYKDCPMPDAQPISQWIPVSEREPKEPEDGFKRYIVQRASNAEPRSLYWDQYGTWLDEEGTPYTDIIAWMPLPEPYKEGE